MQLLQHISPDLAIVSATVGLCLIYLEFNRPGLILPAALGALLSLLAAAALLQHPLNTWAIALLVASTISLVLNAYRVLPGWLLAGATIALCASLRFLLSPSAGPVRVHTVTAVCCGTLLGSLTAVLSRVAFRARAAKAIH